MEEVELCESYRLPLNSSKVNDFNKDTGWKNQHIEICCMLITKITIKKRKKTVSFIIS